MSAPPSFEDVLRQALAGLHNDEVAIFYEYFDDLKSQARRSLGRKAKIMPGDSAIVQSALLSMLADLALQQVPLSDVDDEGQPALWPLLLRYIERHCDRWNKYYLAMKRRAGEVSLQATVEGPEGASRGIDLPDHRALAGGEPDLAEILGDLWQEFSSEEQQVLERRLRDETLEEIATGIGRAESTVSNRLQRIRSLLQDRIK
jgi:DNA-directed RNA polymerase specialized sigma24 family protein